MTLSDKVETLIDDPYLAIFSPLVFEGLTVEDIPNMDDIRMGKHGPFKGYFWFAVDDHIKYHEQRKGE